MTGESTTDVFTAVKAFNNRFFPGWEQRPFIEFSNALAGEIGEACNITKKLNGGGTSSRTATLQDLKRELADIQIYLALFVQRLGMTEAAFQEVVSWKIKRNERRLETQRKEEGIFQAVTK